MDSVIEKIVNINEKVCYKLTNMDYKKLYKKLFKIICIVMAFYVVIEIGNRITNAALIDMFGCPDSIANATSGGDKIKYLKDYRCNYILDVVTPDGVTEFFEKATNGISNWFWQATVGITYILVILFNVAFSMNLADLFANGINTVVSEVKQAVFDNYILLAITVGLIFVVVSFWKRNVTQVFSRLLYMGVAITLATVVANYSGDIISGITQMSMEIGSSVVGTVKSNGSYNGYDPTTGSTHNTTVSTVDVSAEIWYNMVHKPWLLIEGNGSLSEEEETSLEGLLAMKPGDGGSDDERQKKVKEINKKNENLLAKDAGSGRIIPALFTGIINLIKILILVVISLFSILFQILTILLVFFSPVILLLSIVPATGGTSLIAKWGKQILGAQLGIVFTSFIIGTLLRLDGLITDKSTELFGAGGWYAAVVFQTCLYAMVIWQRERILQVLKELQRSFGNGKLLGLADLKVEGIKKAINGENGGQEKVEKKGFFKRKTRKIPEDPAAATATGNNVNGAGAAEVTEGIKARTFDPAAGSKKVDVSQKGGAGNEKTTDKNGEGIKARTFDPSVGSNDDPKNPEINPGGNKNPQFNPGGNKIEEKPIELNPGSVKPESNEVHPELNYGGINKPGSGEVHPEFNLGEVKPDNEAFRGWDKGYNNVSGGTEGSGEHPDFNPGSIKGPEIKPDFNPGNIDIPEIKPHDIQIKPENIEGIEIPIRTSGEGLVNPQPVIIEGTGNNSGMDAGSPQTVIIDRGSDSGNAQTVIVDRGSDSGNVQQPVNNINNHYNDINNIANSTNNNNFNDMSNINNKTNNNQNFNDINKNINNNINNIENNRTQNIDNIRNSNKNIDRTKNVNNINTENRNVNNLNAETRNINNTNNTPRI